MFRGKAAQAVIWTLRNREKEEEVFEMIPLNRQITITMAQTQIDMLPPQHFDSLLQPGAESACNNTGCYNREAHRGADREDSSQKASCLLCRQGRYFKQ